MEKLGPTTIITPSGFLVAEMNRLFLPRAAAPKDRPDSNFERDRRKKAPWILTGSSPLFPIVRYKLTACWTEQVLLVLLSPPARPCSARNRLRPLGLWDQTEIPTQKHAEER